MLIFQYSVAAIYIATVWAGPILWGSTFNHLQPRSGLSLEARADKTGKEEPAKSKSTEKKKDWVSECAVIWSMKMIGDYHQKFDRAIDACSRHYEIYEAQNKDTPSTVELMEEDLPDELADWAPEKDTDDGEAGSGGFERTASTFGLPSSGAFKKVVTGGGLGALAGLGEAWRAGLPKIIPTVFGGNYV